MRVAFRLISPLSVNSVVLVLCGSMEAVNVNDVCGLIFFDRPALKPTS